MRSACSICLPDPSSPDCQGCPDLPLAVSPPADRTLTPTAAPSTDLLRFEAAVGRLRSLPSREQELRARAERAEAEVAEVAKMRMQKAAVGDASSIVKAPEESMVARMAEMHNAVESEQTRWQRAIYEHLCNSLPDGCLDTCIDGGGCDSSDLLEFTTSEISCAITAWASQAERAIAECERLRRIVGEARAELAEERAHHERTLRASVDAIRELCEERGRWEAASHAIRAVCDALGLDRGGDHDLDAILDRIRDVRTERS